MVAIRLAIIYYLFCIVFGDYEQWEEEFDHSTWVDADMTYKMYWTVHKERVEIGLEVELVDGWIGWGISQNGQMTNADVIVAWIEDDGDMTVKLSNYYTTNQRYQGPQLMADQENVELIEGFRDETKSYFRFYRNIHPCTDNTLDIPTGTAKVIYAWNNELPEDEQSIPMHNKTDCGTKSVNLLLGETAEFELPDENIQSFEVHFTDYQVPSDDTTYFCQLVAFPDLDEINHMIRIDPIITPGNEGIVHHITLTACPQQYVNPEDVGHTELCDEWANMPSDASFCRNGAIFAAWAVGGGDFYFPEHVGYEFGGTAPEALKYAIVEVHYDNPQEESGFVDSSGFKIYYTPNLREHSAEMLTIGATTAPTGIFVPPHVPGVVANGFCMGECTSDGIPEDGIHAFGNLLHLHVLGTALKLRHIRDGKELIPIDRNDNYDFDYQQLWLLENEMHILPGDDLYLECHYASPDRDYMTWGGESTRQEMCFSFLYVYPKTELKMCGTQWIEEDWIDFWNTSVANGWANIPDVNDYNTWEYDVSEPEALAYYRDIWQRSQRDMFCIGDADYFHAHRIEIPSESNFEAYTDPDYCAEANESEGFVWNTWYGYSISIALGFIAIALFVVTIRMCRKSKSSNGYRQHLDDEENNMARPTKRSGSGENGAVSLQPSKQYGATTY